MITPHFNHCTKEKTLGSIDFAIGARDTGAIRIHCAELQQIRGIASDRRHLLLAGTAYEFTRIAAQMPPAVAAAELTAFLNPEIEQAYPPAARVRTEALEAATHTAGDHVNEGAASPTISLYDMTIELRRSETAGAEQAALFERMRTLAWQSEPRLAADVMHVIARDDQRFPATIRKQAQQTANLLLQSSQPMTEKRFIDLHVPELRVL